MATKKKISKPEESTIQGDLVFPGPPVKNLDKPQKPIDPPVFKKTMRDEDTKLDRNFPLKGK